MIDDQAVEALADSIAGLSEECIVPSLFSGARKPADLPLRSSIVVHLLDTAEANLRYVARLIRDEEPNGTEDNLTQVERAHLDDLQAQLLNPSVNLNERFELTELAKN